MEVIFEGSKEQMENLKALIALGDNDLPVMRQTMTHDFNRGDMEYRCRVVELRQGSDCWRDDHYIMEFFRGNGNPIDRSDLRVFLSKVQLHKSQMRYPDSTGVPYDCSGRAFCSSFRKLYHAVDEYSAIIAFAHTYLIDI